MSYSAPDKKRSPSPPPADGCSTDRPNEAPSGGLLRDFFSRRYLLFLVSGGSSAVLGVTLRLLFAQFMGYTASVIVSYFFSTLAAYALNKRLVFRGQARSTELGKFFVVNVIGLLQTALLSNAFFKLIEWATRLPVPVAETMGHAVALSTLAVTSFIIHKYWTFSESKLDGKAGRPD
ncbi:GtrA family protein [uncultured Stenotrophomonas sp.]|uniref:GtrA family protein n=1 Tax=uncultured Stenotrophomonas sp. TaxID=165438 RepID=UPI0025CEF107|nr:GtrA family protein [uncultured Stenotrophomonas sp.]